MEDSKFIPSGGFVPGKKPRRGAQDELDMLSYYSQEGWILEQFTSMGFLLKKKEPQTTAYLYDCAEHARAEMPAYIARFAGQGWEYVTSCGEGCHFFKAPAGTPRPETVGEESEPPISPLSGQSTPPPAPVTWQSVRSCLRMSILFWVLGAAALALSAVGKAGGIAVLQMAALALAVLFLFVGSTYFLNFLFTRGQLKPGDRGEDGSKGPLQS
ncbi:DUF2812 domain-containing protein [Bittarella massiliensis (ex Durand et al. 2017)]|uniref:DUF2812 domain-containing protein n=1 Tax=Bittarella massiliensis (ex Durand et al. 2017) TaxID=1720313 RepID=UPI001AA0E9BB|nr:DUF2812 domain-containing protein [Bittarella massiliensis (ex Durand et al. 2017)]MBO1678340.1 DUF2812 domain-containing protein [Bittarella massiliensis (ex Durand et al. 2017)]